MLYAQGVFMVTLPIKVVGISYLPGPGVFEEDIFWRSDAPKPKAHDDSKLEQLLYEALYAPGPGLCPVSRRSGLLQIDVSLPSSVDFES